MGPNKKHILANATGFPRVYNTAITFYAARKSQLSSASNRTENATHEYDKPLQSGFDTKWKDIQAAHELLVPIKKPTLKLHRSTWNFVFEFFFLQTAFICLFWRSLCHVSVLRCLLILWFRMRNLKAEVKFLSLKGYLSTLSFTLWWSGRFLLGSHDVCSPKASLGLVGFRRE